MRNGFIGCMLLFVLAGSLLIGGALLYFGARNLKYGRQSSQWPHTTATIIESEVTKTKSTDDHGPTYRATIVYTYTVGGKEYTSSRITYEGMTSNDPDDAYRITSQYPKDKTVEVYYCPQKASESVLEPGITWVTYILPVMGIVFIVGDLAAVAIVIFAWRTLAKRWQKKPSTAT